MGTGHPPQGGFALRFDVVLVGADLKHRLGSILHPPHDHSADVNWIAHRIVDLERTTFQRFQSTRHLLLRIERIDPPEPWAVLRAHIAAEQQTDEAFVWLEHNKTT